MQVSAELGFELTPQSSVHYQKACAAVANKWKDDEWETVPPSVAMGKYDYNPQTPCEAYV